MKAKKLLAELIFCSYQKKRTICHGKGYLYQKKDIKDEMSCFFFSIRPFQDLLPLLGPLELYVTPKLVAALLCSSRAGSDLGRMSVWFEEL